MNSYEQRQEARRERYEQRAMSLHAEAESASQRADRMASVIPFGQPIHIGHYSERSDRRYRERIHGTMRKALDLDAQAREAEQRAMAVGTGGISADDPDAPDKLLAKLEAAERLQERMKAANKLVRKQDRAGLLALGFTDRVIDKLFTPDFAGRIGFPDYEITNNGAEIRRLKQRIAALAATASMETSERTIPEFGLTIRQDTEDNRLWLLFEERQPAAVAAVIKRYGFKWSPTRRAWVRQLNSAAPAMATAIVAAIKATMLAE